MKTIRLFPRKRESDFVFAKARIKPKDGALIRTLKGRGIGFLILSLFFVGLTTPVGAQQLPGITAEAESNERSFDSFSQPSFREKEQAPEEPNPHPPPEPGPAELGRSPAARSSE